MQRKHTTLRMPCTFCATNQLLRRVKHGHTLNGVLTVEEGIEAFPVCLAVWALPLEELRNEGLGHPQVVGDLALDPFRPVAHRADATPARARVPLPRLGFAL